MLTQELVLLLRACRILPNTTLQPHIVVADVGFRPQKFARIAAIPPGIEAVRDQRQEGERTDEIQCQQRRIHLAVAGELEKRHQHWDQIEEEEDLEIFNEKILRRLDNIHNW